MFVCLFVRNFRKAPEINRRYQNIFRPESIMNPKIEMNEKSRKLDMEIEKVYKTALHRTHTRITKAATTSEVPIHTFFGSSVF